MKPIPSGNHRKIYKIYAICDDRGDCQTEIFLAGIAANFIKSREKIFADMRKAAGNPNGAASLPPARCHDMVKGEGIFEFTGGTSQLRVAWFYDEGKRIICSHAFIKKKPRTPKAEQAIARANKSRYFEAKKNGELTFLPEKKGE